MEKANRTFEEQWRQALEEAEVTPPPQIWVAIDGQLANEQAVGYKKEANFYKWVAAACLLLFALSGSFYWQSNQTAQEPSLTEKGIDSQKTITEPEDHDNQPIPMVTGEQEEEPDQQKENLFADGSTNQARLTTALATNITNSSWIRTEESSPPKLEGVHISEIVPIKAHLPSVVKPWQSERLYGVARTWVTVDEDKITNPLWAGVSFSAGAFDPGFGGSSDDFVFASQEGFLAESAVPQSRSQIPASYSSGQSVAGGLNLGKRVLKRMNLSGGIHYSAFNTGSVSSQLASDEQNNTYALTSETSDSELADALAQGSLTYDGQQVQLANEYQYFTVPIKAGYILLDRKFNITLNTGLSGNFRVNSKLVASGEQEELSNDFSTANDYQNVYFNFLTSVEFGYLFKNHYQFLLEPNYNQALTDFTSSSNPNRGRPKNIGISIGFRYNF